MMHGGVEAMKADVAGAHSCPDPETLAAYIDDRLDAARRGQLEVHAAGCDICSGVLAGTFHEAAEAGALPPWRGRQESWASRRALVAGSLAAAAAVLAVVWVQDGRSTARASEAHLARMAQASDGTRLVEGRLSGFSYGLFSPQTRSARGRSDGRDVVAAAARALETLPADSRAREVLYTRAVAHLMLNDLDASARELGAALEQDASDPRVLNALAVVHLARADDSSGDSDLERALHYAEGAVRADAKSTEAQFNRALSLERLGRTDQAVDAWRDVLRLDTSEWRLEAERRLAKLTGGGGTP